MRYVQLPLVVPILYFLVVMLLVTVSLVTKPKESAIGLAMTISTGVAYYLLVITWTSKPAVLVNNMGTSTLSHYGTFLYSRLHPNVCPFVPCLFVTQEQLEFWQLTF